MGAGDNVWYEGNLFVESCQTACYVRGFAYAALGHVNQCQCGNNVSSASIPVPEYECNQPCQGNVNQTCGAVSGLRVNLYKSAASLPAVAVTGKSIATAALSAPWTNLGCFAGMTIGGDITTTQNFLTLEACLVYCAMNNSPYASLTQGNTCSCGTKMSAYATPAPSASNCSVVCNDNSTEICGGPRGFYSLYQNPSVVAPQSPPNLIVNGGFETAASFCPTGWCPNADQFISPWYKSDTGSCWTEVDTLSTWVPYDGSISMDLNGNCAYSLSQNVSLIPGNPYTLTFRLRTNTCGANTLKTGLVMASGSAPQSFNMSTTAAQTWTLVTYKFVATDINTIITVGSTTLFDGCGPVIDDVEMTQDNYGSPSAIALQPVVPKTYTPSPINVNLVSNGNFEALTIAPWYSSGSSDCPAQLVSGNLQYKAFDGTNSINLK